MKKSKLITFLKTFSKEELQEFEDFVASPFFNKRKDLINFYHYLKRCAPEFCDEHLEKEQVFAQVFPNEPFQEKKLGYLMSYLCTLIEQFLKIKAFQAHKHLADGQWLNTLVERRLFKYYEQEFRKVSKKLDKIAIKDEDFYFGKYQLHDAAVHYAKVRQFRKHEKNVQMVANYLDNYYWYKKIQLGCNMLLRQRIMGTAYDFHFLDEVIHYLSENGRVKEPIIAIFYIIFKMLKEEQADEYFELLKELIIVHQEGLNQEDLGDIYRYAISFCSQKLKQGKINYAEEALNLYLNGINYDIFIEDGYLSPWTYKNIIKLGLGLKRFEWVEEFIEQYNEKLQPDFRQNAMHFNLADLFYYKKDYEQSLLHLNQIKFTDIFYNLGTKLMLLKIYYELDEEEPLLSLLASFSLFLKRNKQISKNTREMYLNFCTILNRIMRRKKEKIPKIRQTIQESKLLTERRWLMERLKEWERNKK